MKIISKKYYEKIKIKYFKKFIPKKLINRLSSFSLIILILQLFSIPFIYKYNKASIKYLLGISSKKDLYNKGGIYKSKLNDLSDFFKDLFTASFTTKKLDSLYLDINLKNASLLACKINKDCPPGNEYIANGLLIFKNKKYDISLRPKGMRLIHNLDFKRMSMRVNIKGDLKFLGMDKFSIQMPIIRGYDSEIFVANLLQKDNLIAPRNRYVKFYVNGEYVGIRHIEESVRTELIEHFNYRNGPIFDLNQKYGDVYSSSRFNLVEKKWIEIDNNLVKNSRDILVSSQYNKSLFKEYFNISKWSKYFAYMEAFQSFHGTLPKSLKFFLNPINGKFEPIFFDGHKDKWHKNTRITDLVYKYENTQDCKSQNIYAGHAVDLCSHIDWYKFIFGNDFNNKEFYIEYINNLEKISSQEFIKNVLKPQWDNLSFYRGNLYKEFWRTDDFYHVGFSPYIASWSSLKLRLKRIREDLYILRTKKPFIEFDDFNNIYIYNNHSYLPQIIYISCNSKKSEPLIAIKDKVLKYDLGLLGDCNSSNYYFSLDNMQSSFLIKNNIEEISSNINFIKSENNIFLVRKKGTINVKSNKIIASDKIIFGPGSRICLLGGSTLILESKNLIFEKSNSLGGVRIESCDNRGGSLIIRNSNVSGKELYADNLISPQLKLMNLYGGINIINSKIVLDNLSILNSRSEDSLNLVDSQLNANNLSFNKIQSDALDLDNSNIRANNIYCKNIGNDCLDLSYSTGRVSFIESDNVRDKVISLGESSNLNVENLYISDSEMGAVSKDKSILFIKNYKYKKVNLPIVSFIKKVQFGPPFVHVSEISPNKLNQYLISKDSFFFLQGKQIKGSDSSEIIKKRLYGNQYGVKTNR